MTTSTRSFLREFAAHKARARRGETVRILDRGTEFVFTAVMPRTGLVGCSKGRIRIVGDLTAPTLAAEAWRPGL
jgi:hypothetical protein